MVAKFEISKDHAGKFRFHLKAPNGEIVAASQGYETKANAEKGIEAIKTHAPDARSKITASQFSMRPSLGSVLVVSVLAVPVRACSSRLPPAQTVTQTSHHWHFSRRRELPLRRSGRSRSRRCRHLRCRHARRVPGQLKTHPWMESGMHRARYWYGLVP
jgi:uncharacterized protein YegP (UPF0339 family)